MSGAEDLVSDILDFDHSEDACFVVRRIAEDFTDDWFGEDLVKEFAGPERYARLLNDDDGMWCCYYAACLVWASRACYAVPGAGADTLAEAACNFSRLCVRQTVLFEDFADYARAFYEREQKVKQRIMMYELKNGLLQ